MPDYGKRQIMAMKRECVSICEIARTLNKSPDATRNFLKHLGRVDGRKCTGNATKNKNTNATVAARGEYGRNVVQETETQSRN